MATRIITGSRAFFRTGPSWWSCPMRASIVVRPGRRMSHSVSSRESKSTRKMASDAEGHAKMVARFLHNACPDHHVRGGPAHVMALHTAERLLKQHPEIARDSFYTAIVCGDVAEVERTLRERPDAARERSSGDGHDRARVGGFEDIFKDVGPVHWEPLLYLCFTRLSFPPANDNAIAIAKLLLDNGANPNAYFKAGDSRYTPLVGAIGEGEENRPPHPLRNA